MPQIPEHAEFTLTALARIVSLSIVTFAGLALPLNTIPHIVVLVASLLVVWKSYDAGYRSIDLIEKHNLIMFQASLYKLVLALAAGLIVFFVGDYLAAIAYGVENSGEAAILIIVGIALIGYSIGICRRAI